MPEGNRNPPPDNLDDMLAQLADRAVEGEDLLEIEGDEELMEFQRLIYSLHKTIEADQPADDMTRRIESNLRIAWSERSEKQQGTKPLFERMLDWFGGNGSYRSRRQRQRRFALITAGAALLLVIVALPVITAGEPSDIPGAAGSVIEVPILVVTAVVFVALAIVSLVISNKE